MAASPSPSPESDGVSIGSVLDGRYRIDAVLGSGGMGRVYRGEHTGIGRAVAIKVLHADLGRNREATARFQREALASGRLDHPNIVGVSDFGVLDDGACFLVMEALEGESLGERLEREKRIHWREALSIMRGVFAGLKHAHDRGVVHRDIKPDNIFLARKESEVVVKILDFGIAKLAAGTGEDPASTRAGLTVGTPAYLSPEQAVGGEIKPASDIYSATIVLFELLAGRTPFHEKEPLAMLGAHVSRQPPHVREVAPEVEMPPGLEELIQHGLVKTASDRIASAAEYMTAIDGICATVQPYGSAPNYVTPPPHVSGAVPAAVLGVMPTSSLTPIPMSGPISGQISGQMPISGHPNDTGGMWMADSMTPFPAAGSMTPMPSAYHTPVPGSMQTPVPSSMQTPPPVSGAAPTALLPTTPVPGSLPTSTSLQQHAVSLPAAPAIPRQWLKLGLLVLGGLVILAIAMSLGGGKQTTPIVDPTKLDGGSAKATKDGKDNKDGKDAGKASKDGKDKPKPSDAKGTDAKATDPQPTPKSLQPPDEPPPAPPVDDPEAKQLAFKAALHDLQKGATCPARREAVTKLRELGDPKAIPHLKRAKYRMRGGVLGIGSSNTNGCLVKDVDAAIKALTPPKK